MSSSRDTVAIRPRQINQDKLEALRMIVRAHRDLQNRIAGLEEELKSVRKAKFEMETKELPDMFLEVGVDKVGIPEEGNYPAYDAVLSAYYHANISTDMSTEQKTKAFEWLEGEGHGDLIKTVVKVELGRGQREKAKEVEKMLQKLGIDYSRDLGVPWNTLTAWLKEQVEKDAKLPPLELIGGFIGSIVKLKERKRNG